MHTQGSGNPRAVAEYRIPLLAACGTDGAVPVAGSQQPPKDKSKFETNLQ